MENVLRHRYICWYWRSRKDTVVGINERDVIWIWV
jgi:hypothetical protein